MGREHQHDYNNYYKTSRKVFPQIGSGEKSYQTFEKNDHNLEVSQYFSDFYGSK